MTDYEKRREQDFISIEADKKHDEIYKQCSIEEGIARINGEYNSIKAAELDRKRLQADLERDLLRNVHGIEEPGKEKGRYGDLFEKDFGKEDETSRIKNRYGNLFDGLM